MLVVVVVAQVAKPTLSLVIATVAVDQSMRSFLLLILVARTCSFLISPISTQQSRCSSLVVLSDMKRPILDQIASTLFRLENKRVEESSEMDDQGRMGEPMEWSERNSAANQWSELLASNPLGYRFKQWVADIIAGDYDEEEVRQKIDTFITSHDKNKNAPIAMFSFTKNKNPPIAMFSFTTCPFCRRAKDALDERGIAYQVIELDDLEGNQGNEIRAQLGKITTRTSVPSIFVRGQYIGGCNDGPGLMPLMESGELDRMLSGN